MSESTEKRGWSGLLEDSEFVLRNVLSTVLVAISILVSFGILDVGQPPWLLTVLGIAVCPQGGRA